MGELARRGSAILGLSASLSSFSSSEKSLLTLSNNDNSDAFQNRDNMKQVQARAKSLASAGVEGAIFKAVWSNPLLTISQKEAIFPTGWITLSDRTFSTLSTFRISSPLAHPVTYFHPPTLGNKEVLQQVAEEEAIKQRKASTGNITLFQKMGFGSSTGPNDDASLEASVPLPSDPKVIAKSSGGESQVPPSQKPRGGYAAALVWSSDWLAPEIKEYLYPRALPNSVGKKGAVGIASILHTTRTIHYI